MTSQSKALNLQISDNPRPQFARESFTSLNGQWSLKTSTYQGEIIVPFSPETKLSQVGRQFSEADKLLYHRCFQVPEDFDDSKRLILNFGAVDQICQVLVNGKKVGEHKGGYTSFSFDITDYLKENPNEVDVIVEDKLDKTGYGYGKQSRNPKGIWYPSQSGIWQDVWFETVAEQHLEKVKIDIDFDQANVSFTMYSNFPGKGKLTIPSLGIEQAFEAEKELTVNLPSFENWSPENPVLYPFELTFGKDRVTSYFAMRKFSVEEGRLCLNNKPYFHTGVLDQGYWPDSLLTPPSDEAMIFDIEQMKALGFNVLRKHIKVEPMRWYYHCDHLGMLVWQDIPSGGTTYNKLLITAPLVTSIHLKDNKYRLFARKDAEARENWQKEMIEIINQLYNVPSICMWVPFNEGWGQFDSVKTVKSIEEIDKSRTIDHASGWHDQGVGAFKSLHVYFKPYRFKADKKGRAVILTEFGGYTFAVKDHCNFNKTFGYKETKTFDQLNEAYKKLYEEQIIPAKEKGLQAAIYTQLSDVEQEINGFYTYDRKVLKFDSALVKELNDKLKKD